MCEAYRCFMSDQDYHDVTCAFCSTSQLSGAGAVFDEGHLAEEVGELQLTDLQQDPTYITRISYPGAPKSPNWVLFISTTAQSRYCLHTWSLWDTAACRTAMECCVVLSRRGQTSLKLCWASSKTSLNDWFNKGGSWKGRGS